MRSRRPNSRFNRGRIAGLPAGLLTNAIANIGDSITQGAGSTGDNGWRIALYNHCVAQTYPFIFVGPRNHGTFGAVADRRHDGLPAAQTAARLVDIRANYGVGAPVADRRGGKLALLMMGTNDMRQPGGQYNQTNSINNFAQAMAHLAGPLGWPFARILVQNCLNIDGATEPEAAGRVAPFNTALWTMLDNFNTAHPSRPCTRYDANAAVGAYNAANYIDAFHLNDTGYGLLNPGLVIVADPDLAVEA